MRKRVRVAVCLLSALVAVSAVQAVPIAELRLNRSSLDFTALVDAERFVLTVGSPNGTVSRREYAAGEAISFSFGDSGEAIADGSYNWELTAAPRLRPGDRARLAEARSTGDAAAIAEAQRAAGIPAGGMVQSGSFRVVDGAIVDSATPEGKGGLRNINSPLTNVSAADQVIPDDLIVQGSACVGLDCINNENFGFDTIRMRENNLRIHFDDTSVQAGFPANDWRLIANDSASGGSSKFSIEDSTSSKTPFTITAGASTNSIFADSTGRIGLRTSTPVLDLHINTSNTPAIRLEQNNSGGFTAQTWDIGANEANFFVRDVTGGSLLSFRVRPGAPTSSVDISSDGDVGIGTGSPSEKLHILGSDGTNKLLVQENNGTTTPRELLEIRNNGNAVFILEDTTVGERWTFTGGGNFLINNQGNPGVEYTFGPTGNAVAAGTFTPASSRFIKHGFGAIDASEVLDKVVNLPITTWSYDADPSTRRIGPMSEDFFAAFGVGDDKGISVTDSAGVALAAIQGLHQEIAARDAEIAALQAQLAELVARLDQVEKRR